VTGPRYANQVDVPLSHDEAVAAVIEQLGKEGFGVLTTIDVKATLKKKLGEDVAPYTILGACNPPLAHKALQAEEAIGILLPCNVVVKAIDDRNSRVFITDVSALFDLVGRDDIAPIADEVGARLARVAACLAAAST